MKYSEIRNLQWADAEHTVLNCEVNFNNLVEEFVPFTASADDLYDHTKDIFEKAVAGEFGEIAEYVEPPVPEIIPPPAPTKEQLMAKLLEIQAQLENM